MQENLRDHGASSFGGVGASGWIRLATLYDLIDLPGFEGNEREGESGDPIGEGSQEDGHTRKVMPTCPKWVGINPTPRLFSRYRELESIGLNLLTRSDSRARIEP